MRYFLKDKDILVYSEFCPVPEYIIKCLRLTLQKMKIFVGSIFGFSRPINDFVREYPIFEKKFVYNYSHHLIKKLPIPVMFMELME